MTRIISDKPVKTCPACGCIFEFTAEDVHTENEQYWAGFWKAWKFREHRYVECPGCKKEIQLN